jgi:hypothetical protein
MGYLDELNLLRPQKLADCQGGLRPCPFLDCRYHQFWELPGPSSKYLKKTDAQIVEIISSLNPSCFWDYFEEREHTLEEIGAYLGGVSRERIRQWLDGGDNGPGILEKLRKTRSPEMLQIRESIMPEDNLAKLIKRRSKKYLEDRNNEFAS